MERQFEDAIERQTAQHLAKSLLASEKKELKKLTRFNMPVVNVPDGVHILYAIKTPDGPAALQDGDYVLQTLDNSFYYLRINKEE